MASIRKRGERWQARVIRFGYPDQSKTFATRQDAERWARSIESDIDKGIFLDRALAERTSFGEVIERYVSSVCPLKRGGLIEQRRLLRLKKTNLWKMAMANIRPRDIAEYRDQRLQKLKTSTMNRELQLLGAVTNHAMREWGIALPFNPVEKVRKPSPGRGRTRVLSAHEEVRLLAAIDGASYLRIPRVNFNAWIKPIVQLALETACRRGELLSMRWEYVELERRVVRLPLTKNGEERFVPLSTRAVEILDGLPRSEDGQVFPIPWTALHQAFRKACKRADINDLKFHDLRHTATTRLASRLPNVIELAAVTGHKSLAMLKRYYHTTPEELARKIG